MESQTREVEDGSLFSGNLVKTVVFGGIIGAAGVLLLGRNKYKGHTIPPIIIKSADDGSSPVEIETVKDLEEARTGLQKKEYKTKFPFGRTKWVVIELRNTGGDWVKYGFGRKIGLDVRIYLQVWKNGSWDNDGDSPHLVISGKSERFPLTTEELTSAYIPGHARPYKRRYKEHERRRIRRIEVGSFEPLSPLGTDYVEVGFYDH